MERTERMIAAMATIALAAALLAPTAASAGSGPTAVQAAPQGQAPRAPGPAPAPPDAPAAAPTDAPVQVQPDAVRVTLPERAAALLAGGPRAGRMILFLVDKATPARDAPSDAPFYDRPQPMFSVAVEELVPGRAVRIDAASESFPVPLDALDGTYRVQALFRRNREERGHLAPGNLLSAEATATFRRGAPDQLDLELSTRIDAEPRPSLPNLRWFEMRSELLSAAAGREVKLRAGVALPPGWDDPNHRRRIFPAVYVVPWFGARWNDAARIAKLLADPATAGVMAPAVHVTLDPESPLAHHGFVDSPANGPWGTALVTELIPALEREFRLAPRPEARIVTGHSSGGWGSLWLQLSHPDTFGACFASSPDPVDFSRFQACDLLRDASVFTDADGRERPMHRTTVADGFDKVNCTVREAVMMERVLGPAHDSGEQWDTWASMWGPVDPATKLPRPVCDGATGTIDRAVVDGSWVRYDVAGLVRADPGRFVPLFRERVRLLCGMRDNFYFDRAVAGLRDAVRSGTDALMAAGQMLPEGPGYIELLPGEDHRSMVPAAAVRWHGEMREHLKRHGLD
jgi:hypothetical protein